MTEDYLALDQRDEKQIIAELQGQVIDEMYYHYTKPTGETVTGISWTGIKEITRNYGNIQTSFIKLQDQKNSYLAVIKATDTLTGASLIGTSTQPKTRDNKPDPYAQQIAISKAQRNAIRALIPETYLKKTYQKWLKQRKTKQTQDTSKQPTSKPVKHDPTSIKNYLKHHNIPTTDLTITYEPTSETTHIKPPADHPEWRTIHNQLTKLPGTKWNINKQRWETPL